MLTRPPTSTFDFVLLLGAGALLVLAVSSALSQGPVDAGRSLTLACGGVLAGLGGFKVGRLMASGQLFLGTRVCRWCNAKRTTSAAFCESCHRRD